MKFTTKAAGLMVALATSAAVAGAQINFVGTTAATFGSTGTNTVGGLTIANGAFNTTTNSFGFAAIGGSGVNLGVVNLASTTFNYVGQTLRLAVTFTAPAGANSQTFTSTLVGAVTGSNNGGVQVSFVPNVAMGSFNGGSYMLTVNNFSITPNQANVEITGTITAAVVPEPSTYALMGTGLAGLVAAGLRRRRVASV